MSTTPQYALLFTEGERAGEALGLDQPEITLGRSRQAQICLNDELLSRKHLVFRQLGEDLVLEDLDSAHGTFLNEKRLRGIQSVQPGDEIVAGSQKFKVTRYEEVAELAAESMRELDAIDQAADAAGSEPVEEDEDDKTRFGAGEEDQDETRYHQAHDVAYDEEEDDAKTRVLADQATRMLDVEELQGLKAGKGEGTDTRKVALGILLLVLLLGGGAFGLIRYFGAGDTDQNALVDYADTQYGFSLTYPAVYEKTGTDPEASIMFEYRVEGASIANCKVFADQSLKHEVTGLSLGFRDYQDELKRRHPGYRLKGSKLLQLNGMRLIQFGYAADDETGFGLFTYDGGTRYLVEASVESSSYYAFKDELLEILGSFTLNGDQSIIDFPLADQEIRHQALGNPQALAAEAKKFHMLGRDLMTRREVRLDNLYNAIDNFRKSLQRTSELSTRPDFHEDVALDLLKASELLNQEIKDQRYKITMAEKTGDQDAVLFELSKLMRMIPDKNDPVHMQAREDLEWYGGL